MSKQTVIVGPDGGKTTITTSGGCCAGFGTFLLVLVVLFLPASFAAPWNVIAYVGLGVIVAVAIGVAAVGQAQAKP